MVKKYNPFPQTKKAKKSKKPRTKKAIYSLIPLTKGRRILSSRTRRFSGLAAHRNKLLRKVYLQH